MAAKCGSRRSWKLKVKPNLCCRNNIAMTISYISFFHFILITPRLTELRLFKCQGHPVNLWRWPLTCDLEKTIMIFAFIDETLPLQLAPGANLSWTWMQRATFRSPCDVIDDVITIKNIFVALSQCAYGCPKLEFSASQHGGGLARSELSEGDSVVVTRLQLMMLAGFGYLMRIFVQATEFGM